MSQTHREHRKDPYSLRGFDSTSIERIATRSCVVILTTLIVFLIYLRIDGIEQRGLTGHDEVYYTTIAESWSNGEPIFQVGTGPYIFRPVSFMLMAASFKLFGHNDTSIKLMNVFLSIISIVVFAAILYHLLRKRQAWFILTGTLLYTTMPVVPLMARREMTSASSSLMVLLSFLFIVLYSKADTPRRSYLYLTFCGVFVILASLTHEDFIFLLLGYALCLVAMHWGEARKTQTSAKKTRRDLALFALIGSVVALLFLLYMLKNSEYVGGLLRRIFRLSPEQIVIIVERTLRYYWNSVLGNSSTFFFFLFLLILVLIVGRWTLRWANTLRSVSSPWRTSYAPIFIVTAYLLACGILFWTAILGSSGAFFFLLLLLTLGWIIARWVKRGIGTLDNVVNPPRAYYFSILVVTGYMLAAGFIFNRYWPRLALPLVPLILIFVIVWAHFFLERWPQRRSIIAVLGCALVLMVSHYGHFADYPNRAGNSPRAEVWFIPNFSKDWRWRTGLKTASAFCCRPGWSRNVHNEVKDIVNEDARLLVAPSLMMPSLGRRHLQTGIYLGDNALYMIDHTEPLDVLIDRYRIRYVLLSRFREENRYLREEVYDQYRYQGRWENVPLQLGASYGFEPGGYSVEREFDYLLDYLLARDAKIISAMSGATGIPARSQGALLKAEPTKAEILSYLEKKWTFVVFAL